MSILAEPRRKQRISIDPQNIAWKNDNEKFGQKLMEKMGWSEGKGLGLKEQGMSDNLKLKANHTAKGLGCEQGYDTTWIAHHDDFASLLANLKKKKPESEEKEGSDGVKKEKKEKKVKSLEETSKSSKARIHYHKFTRGKDLSRFSANDLSSVIGIGISRKRKHSPEPEPEISEGEEPMKKARKEKSEEKRCVEANTGFAHQTSVSTVSVNDYFKEKMRLMKERAEAAKKAAEAAPAKESEAVQEAGPEPEQEEREETEKERKIRKQKRKEEKKRLKEEACLKAEAENEVQEEEKVVEETEEERRIRKQKKKEAKRLRKLADDQENKA
ncbi:hypothetical protein L596_007841 [Steinernema carpocapsae]|uniref:G-patch domain-containing protein n=1 Tax=Steinernema carpocapsae TaxID=34508 RepID=A0A4U5PAL5_STECR|nr:hypothetical protein L596_007841 [Steinernema carpocapsae]